MLLKIKLSDQDREKYKLPEWVELDVDNPPFSDVKRLKLDVGMSWVDLRNGLLAQDLYAAGVAMWIAIRRAGADVPFDEFDIDVNGVVAVTKDDDDPNSSGPDGDGPTSTSSRRSSRASTASTRGTSKGSRPRSSTRTSKS